MHSTRQIHPEDKARHCQECNLQASCTADRGQSLKRWAKRAGISKTVSFHVGRHTFATLGLANGIDLYVMSKLLGHRRVETTEIYAKVIDKSKRDAVQMLPRLNGQKEQQWIKMHARWLIYCKSSWWNYQCVWPVDQGPHYGLYAFIMQEGIKKTISLILQNSTTAKALYCF